MGVLFKPSAPMKSDEEQLGDCEQNHLDNLSKLEAAAIPETDPPKNLEFRNTELQRDFESISLPPTQQNVEAANDGTITEFCPQLIAILPGENNFSSEASDW